MKNIPLRKVWKNGFTLVELLIVIIIIAVLAAIAIPKFANSSIRSKESALRGNLKIVRDSVDVFRADTGCYPATLGELAVSSTTVGLNSTGGGCTYVGTDYRGPYLQAVPNDPTDAQALGYATTGAGTGKVTAHNTGASSDGSLYSTW